MKQPVTIPNKVSKDDAITAAWANGLRRSIRLLANAETQSPRTAPYRKTVPPFFVYLDAQSDYSYKVRVSTGRVIEKLAADENPPILLHEPSNIIATESSDEERKVEGFPLEFDITEDQYVCVTCYVLQDGSIGVDETENPGQEPVTVTIRDDYEATLPVENYDPNYGNTGVIHYPLARVVLDRTVGEFDEYSILKLEPMMMGSHIMHILGAGEDDGPNHEWKTSYQGEVAAVHYWFVKGGDVVTQGGTFTVPDTVVTGASGYALLKIVRDDASREATAATIETTLAASITTSDYADQYIALAKVDVALDPSERVLQLQFERLNIHEMLVVSNGVFDLAQFRMASNNIYDPPP